MPEHSEHHNRNNERRSGKGRNERHEETSPQELTPEQIQAMVSTIAQQHSEVEGLKATVSDLKRRIGEGEKPKPTEPAKAEEPAKPAEIPKPATPPPVQKPTPPPRKSFFETAGDKLKKIGEAIGKVTVISVGVLLSPVIVTAKIIEGFVNGLTKPFSPPKKAA